MAVPALIVLIAMLFLQCEKDYDVFNDDDARIVMRAKPTVDVGNNLSYPVIWADNAQVALRGDPGMTPILEGEWWYVWGPDPIDPNSDILACPPDPEDNTLCLDGSTPGEGYDNLVKAYIQKDPDNIWQAGNIPGSGITYVDIIDWGDNLESVDWTTRSQIRTEVVLYKTDVTMLEYPMKHVSGWGTNEVHGIATTLNDVILEAPGTQATVYSDNARLTIQKLLIDRDEILDGMLEWQSGVGWTEVDPETDYINPPIFNAAAHEDAGYSAEVNVKGKVIYGYTWKTRNNNEGPGDYRITFSFDERTNLMTSLENASILVPLEEEEIVYAESSSEGGGATAVLITEENLTYIDIRLTEKTKGKR